MLQSKPPNSLLHISLSFFLSFLSSCNLLFRCLGLTHTFLLGLLFINTFITGTFAGIIRNITVVYILPHQNHVGFLGVGDSTFTTLHNLRFVQLDHLAVENIHLFGVGLAKVYVSNTTGGNFQSSVAVVGAHISAGTMSNDEDDELEALLWKELEADEEKEEETYFPREANVLGSCNIKVCFARGVRFLGCSWVDSM